jgi:DNA-binding transcriptional regulator YbjK
VPEGSGRVNQKRRTRQAIVEAAQRLIDGGTVPTVADAAAATSRRRTPCSWSWP